jgi:hypothetical protein
MLSSACSSSVDPDAAPPPPPATGISNSCPIKCLAPDSDSGDECTKWQLPMWDPSSDTEVSVSVCPTVDLTTHAPYVGPSIYSGGRLHYCADAELSATPTGCTEASNAEIYNECNSDWSEFSDLDHGFNYAQYWKTSCQYFAEQLVQNGTYAAVSCYNESESLFGIEVGQYVQAWRSTGWDASTAAFANSLACQLDRKYLVTECDELGNLCDTAVFIENSSGSGLKSVVEDGGPDVITFFAQLLAAIAQAFGG